MRLTWQEKLVLHAAADVDHIPFEAVYPGSNIPNQGPNVCHGLVKRGLLHEIGDGWEITLTGLRALM